MEVPIAMNTQNIAAMQPKIESMQNELKQLPVLQTKLDNVETSTSSRFTQNENNIR